MQRAIFEVKTRLLMRADRRALAAMTAVEHLDAQRRSALVDERSASIATHAFATVPFYRDRWRAAGFTTADVAQAGNFTALPVLTKDDIRGAGDALLSETVPRSRALASKTGGSTGAPVLAHNDAGAPTAAMWWRMYGWWGAHPADDTAYVYRILHTGRAALMNAVQWWPTTHLHLDARAVTDDAIDAFLDTWDRVRPRLLVGYAQGLVDVAQRIAATGRVVAPPIVVSSTASVLQPGQRALIERVFGARVVDTYRSAEIPWMASECTAHSGLHIPIDQRRIDIIDDDAAPATAGSVGRLLVTDFTNRVAPFVRYDIGDRSRMIDGDCPCGRTLPRIAAVDGRVADVLRTPSGLHITGGLSGLLLRAGSTVRQMQIVQRSDWSIELRYVVDTTVGTADVSAAVDLAVAELADRLRGEVPVSARRVDGVESVGGKARLVLSELSELPT